MKPYRYKLQDYKSKNSRFKCYSCGHKQSMAKYIDIETNEFLGDHVGRCERVDKCGYHFTPKMFFDASGEKPKPLSNEFKSSYVEPVIIPNFIDVKVYNDSLTAYHKNNFILFLINRFGKEKAENAIKEYNIGTSSMWPGSTVFWQVDKDNNVRSGKIMQYDIATGKRIKFPYNKVSWVHSALKLENFNLKQCLFGEHLLYNTTKPIAIVESEKSAIIASLYLPQFTWLASSSKQGFNNEKVMPLKNRKVVLYPDINAYVEWKKKAEWYGFTISDLLENKATDHERAQGWDLADFLLKFEISDFSDKAGVVTKVKTRNIPGPDTVLPDDQNLTKPDIEQNITEPQNLSKLDIETESKKSVLTLELIELHAKYMAAESTGALDNHPQRSWIDSMWQGVLMYAARPQQQEYYIKELQIIQL